MGGKYHSRRILTDEQERIVALCRFCGVDVKRIEERWNISRPTITYLIGQVRSSDWNDPLVELYRPAKFAQRPRNAAHFYLSYQGVELEDSGLVDQERDQEVMEVVQDEIYIPQITRIVGGLALDEYMKPSSAVEALVTDIFGLRRDPYGIVEPVFVDSLTNEFQYEDVFSLDDVVDTVKGILVDKLKRGDYGVTHQQEEVVMQALAQLDERLKDIITRIYGLSDGVTESHSTIRLSYGVSTARITQLKNQALERLRQSQELAEAFGIQISD